MEEERTINGEKPIFWCKCQLEALRECVGQWIRQQTSERDSKSFPRARSISAVKLLAKQIKNVISEQRWARAIQSNAQYSWAPKCIEKLIDIWEGMH